MQIPKGENNIVMKDSKINFFSIIVCHNIIYIRDRSSISWKKHLMEVDLHSMSKIKNIIVNVD